MTAPPGVQETERAATRVEQGLSIAVCPLDRAGPDDFNTVSDTSGVSGELSGAADSDGAARGSGARSLSPSSRIF